MLAHFVLTSVRDLLVKGIGVPVCSRAIYNIKFGKHCSTTDFKEDFIQGWNLIVFLNDGLIYVMGSTADAECATRIVEVGQAGYPFHRFGYLGNDFEVDHVLQGFLYLFMVLYGHFPVGVLNRGYGGVCVYGVGAEHISNCVK